MPGLGSVGGRIQDFVHTTQTFCQLNYIPKWTNINPGVKQNRDVKRYMYPSLVNCMSPPSCCVTLARFLVLPERREEDRAGNTVRGREGKRKGKRKG